jgi:hypothetical protein
MLDLMILPIRSEEGHVAYRLAAAVLDLEVQQAAVDKQGEQLGDG